MLRPCPFCGDKNPQLDSVAQYGKVVRYQVFCPGCGAVGPHDNVEESAVDLWNIRRPHDRLGQILDRHLERVRDDVTATFNDLLALDNE